MDLSIRDRLAKATAVIFCCGRRRDAGPHSGHSNDRRGDIYERVPRIRYPAMVRTRPGIWVSRRRPCVRLDHRRCREVDRAVGTLRERARYRALRAANADYRCPIGESVRDRACGIFTGVLVWTQRGAACKSAKYGSMMQSKCATSYGVPSSSFVEPTTRTIQVPWKSG